MKRWSTLIPAATLLAGVLAGDADNTWAEWTTTVVAAPVTVTAEGKGWTDWVTDYITTTDTVYKTVPTTVYITDSITTTETVVKTETEVQTSVVTPPPVTITATKGAPPPEIQTETVTVTVTAGAPPPGTVTAVVSTAETVYNTATVSNERTITGVVTSLSVVTQTVSVSFCSSSAPPAPITDRLVPCPSRITNTEYSPPTPLPDNYLWGCPPGKLCRPKQVGCNFESNPPALGYICAPEDCYTTENLPPVDSYLGLEDVNSSCAWLTPQDHYFNINPTFFELDFSIFKTYGQPECTTVVPPPPPPPVTTPTTSKISTTSVAPPPPPPPPSTTQSTWKQWTTSVAPPPPPPPAPVTTTWQVWTTSAPAPPAVSSSWVEWSESSEAPVSSAWGGWQQSQSVSSAGWNSWPAEKRSNLKIRQAQGVILAPPQCYAVCNAAGNYFQKDGKTPSQCDEGSDLQDAIDNAIACSDKYASSNGVVSKVDILNEAISYCNGIAGSSTSAAAAESTSPASTPAQTTPASSAAAPTGSSEGASSAATGSSGAGSTAGSVSVTSAATSAATGSSSATGTVSVSSLPPGGGATSNMVPNTFLSLILSVLAFMLRL